jgi:hypothetical protein
MKTLEPSVSTSSAPGRVELFYKLLDRVIRLFRKKRMLAFQQMFPISKGTRILDVGGTRLNWELLPARP